MRFMNSVLLIAVLVMQVACSTKGGSAAPPPIEDAVKASSDALATLQQLVTDANYKSLGFDSVAQVKTAALAAPMPVFEIGLDRLKSYQAGQDVGGLLTPSQASIYPVTADGQTKSSITVVKRPNGYVPSSFGNAEIAKGLARYRGSKTADSFAVHVPVLGMYFLATRKDNGLTLTPVTESRRLSFRVGVAVPAEEVVKAIVPLVQTYNGLPL